MPVYDFTCEKCGLKVDNELTFTWEDVPECCGQKMKREFPTTVNVYAFPSEGITLEHVGPQPKTFHSKDEMRRFAKENDMELGAL